MVLEITGLVSSQRKLVQDHMVHPVGEQQSFLGDIHINTVARVDKQPIKHDELPPSESRSVIYVPIMKRRCAYRAMQCHVCNAIPGRKEKRDERNIYMASIASDDRRRGSGARTPMSLTQRIEYHRGEGPAALMMRNIWFAEITQPRAQIT